MSIIVGTCGTDLAPEAVRAVGLRVAPDARSLTVLVPAVTGATTLANLRANPRIAVTFSYPPTHRTFQIKGPVLAIRDADEADRAVATAWREGFAASIATLGHAPRKVYNVRIWPAHAIDVSIEQVFAQTPGPKAGAPLAPGTS